MPGARLRLLAVALVTIAASRVNAGVATQLCMNAGRRTGSFRERTTTGRGREDLHERLSVLVISG